MAEEVRCSTCNDTGRVQEKLEGGFIPSNEVGKLSLAEQFQLVGTNPGVPCPNCARLGATTRLKSEELEPREPEPPEPVEPE